MGATLLRSVRLMRAAFLFALASISVGCGGDCSLIGYSATMSIGYPGSEPLNQDDPGMVIQLKNTRTGVSSEAICDSTADCTLHPAQVNSAFVDGKEGDTIELTILDSTKTEELLHYDALPATYGSETHGSGDCETTVPTLSLTIDKRPSAPTVKPDGGVDGGTDGGVK